MRPLLQLVLALGLLPWASIALPSASVSPRTCDSDSDPTETASLPTTTLPPKTTIRTTTVKTTTYRPPANTTINTRTISYGNKTTSLCPCATRGPQSPTCTDSDTSDAWTGPDWSSFGNGTLPQNTTAHGPPVKPRAPTDATVSLLVRTVQDQAAKEYELQAGLACFIGGSTLNCNGTWLYGQDWNRDSLTRHIEDNTVVKPSYECSYDSAYLQSEKYRHVFYGFSAANVSDTFEGAGNFAAVYATNACRHNATCAKAYGNDTMQMYVDYAGWVNATFISHLTSLLPTNGSKSFCPNGLGSYASVLSFATQHFDPSREYLGVHDVTLIPGVARSLNTTVQEARKELGLIFNRNARKMEGVFLNIVFFNYKIDPKLKRSVEEDGDVYPGCPRRTWVIHGECPGVIPPRGFDMAGTVLSMKDRDKMEVLGALASRDTGCESAIRSIHNKVTDFKAAEFWADQLTGFVAIVTPLALAASSSAAIPVGGLVFGIVGMAVVSMMATCKLYNTCSGIPPFLLDASKAFYANPTLQGFQNVVPYVTAPPPWVNSVGWVAAGLDFYMDYIFEHAANSYRQAETCCEQNCASAVCAQASLGCLLTWGEFFSGQKGSLNCGAT
ncbi:hypothetical protein B0T24DRAFT_715869 [Lasiosphaeria ovina]|uniref:Uncharacterized protein n=1 Tax=Lasiosphaeria ovina TaxID=92902 RepID=A0AAE0NMH3_9PEZI|nr:hypothetical protein B0T24DRAFT_715869 [Lasiosphaeria ovina]